MTAEVPFSDFRPVPPGWTLQPLDDEGVETGVGYHVVGWATLPKNGAYWTPVVSTANGIVPWLKRTRYVIE